jgi:hypothetical protein
MDEYREISESISVPKNTGIDGFLRSIKTILQLPRVQRIVIDSKGKVTYDRLVLNGESKPVGVDFEDLEPWGVIRNGEVQEISMYSNNAAIVITALLDHVSLEKMYPVAFVTGANTIFNKWYTQTTGFRLTSDQFICGVPLLKDRNIPDTALIVCATAYIKGALIDTQKSFKIEMAYIDVPNTTVEVL